MGTVFKVFYETPSYLKDQFAFLPLPFITKMAVEVAERVLWSGTFNQPPTQIKVWLLLLIVLFGPLYQRGDKEQAFIIDLLHFLIFFS